jgi:gamma-glutamylputrescine oxidase
MMSKSIWLEELGLISVSGEEKLPERVDVVIVGAGITGLAVAHGLRHSSLKVIVLDQRGLAQGATGRNGGHLNPGTVTDFYDAVRQYGESEAAAVWNFTEHSVERTKRFLRDTGTDCELMENGSVFLSQTKKQTAKLEQNFKVMEKSGIKAEFWDSRRTLQQMKSEKFECGIFRKQGAKLWPAKVVFALASQCERAGIQFVSNCKVSGVVPHPSKMAPCSLVSTDLGVIAADHVVFATNAWSSSLLNEFKDVIVPVRGQALCTAPTRPMWPFNFLCNDGFEYCIQRPDNRIVLGGMRHKSPTHEVGTLDDGVVNPEISVALRRFLPEFFPALSGVTIEREWTGIMGFSKDFNPLIGALPQRSGCYIAAGYTGHGMCMAFAAGEWIAHLIKSAPHKNGQSDEIGSDLLAPPTCFRPDRFSAAFGSENQNPLV